MAIWIAVRECITHPRLRLVYSANISCIVRWLLSKATINPLPALGVAIECRYQYVARDFFREEPRGHFSDDSSF